MSLYDIVNRYSAIVKFFIKSNNQTMMVGNGILSLMNGVYRKQRCERRPISGTTGSEETDAEVVQQKVKLFFRYSM